jgi:hypothetical protein
VKPPGRVGVDQVGAAEKNTRRDREAISQESERQPLHAIAKLRRPARSIPTPNGEMQMNDTIQVSRDPDLVSATDTKITRAMLQAGASAVGVCLDETSASLCELVAREVFLAMDAAREN